MMMRVILQVASLFLVLLSELVEPSIQAASSSEVIVQQEKNKEHETVGLLDQSGRAKLLPLTIEGESILLPDRPGRQRRFSHIKASLLTIGLFATAARNLFWVEGPTTRHDWVGFIVLFFLYLLEAATCSTRRYLSNIRTPSEVKEYFRQLQEAPPRVWFHLECYHYDDDDAFRYHSSSRQRHESSHSKRVTHQASDLFQFKKWRDATKLEEAIEFLEYGTDEKATYLKITLRKLILFMTSAAYQEYLLQHSRFALLNGNRDQYTDSWTTIEVDGYNPKLLAVRTVLGSAAHVRMPIFWIFTLLGLTVPYRMWFSRNCDTFDLAISKEVS